MIGNWNVGAVTNMAGMVRAAMYNFCGVSLTHMLVALFSFLMHMSLINTSANGTSAR
jgi:hypothetical protein